MYTAEELQALSNNYDYHMRRAAKIRPILQLIANQILLEQGIDLSKKGLTKMKKDNLLLSYLEQTNNTLPKAK